VFFVLVVFLWLEMETRMGGTAGISDINKALVLVPDPRDLAWSFCSSQGLHGGGRRTGKKTFDTASGSSSSAASRRPKAAIPPIFIAEGRLLRVGLCQLIFNLQARAPFRRPILSFGAAFNINSDPSGLVLGVGEDGCASRLRLRGGEGPDCVPLSRSRVLFEVSEDLVVIVFSFKVLFQCCNPPTIIKQCL
jgi:hypothetical protein